MRTLAELVIRFRVAVLVATAVVTMALVVQMRSLSVIIDPNNLLPPSHPLVIATNRVEQVFGSKYVVVIGLTAREGDALQPAVLDKVRRLTLGLAEVPGAVKENILSLSARRAKNIVGTGDGLEVKPLLADTPQTPSEVEALKRAILANPVYLNTVVSPDWTTAAVIAEFRDPPQGFGSIMARVHPLVDAERDGSVEIAISGLPVFLSKTESLSQRMAFLFPLAVLIIGIIHYEAFRTLQAAALPLVTALLAVLWALGIMGFSGVPMDVFNATTPILILAVAAGHAVQILKRYYEEYHRLRETTDLEPRAASRAAVVESIGRVGPVMLAAGSAAIVGFLSLVVFEISAVRTFGVFTAFGLLSALILELTFIPALRSMLPPPGASERRRERQHTVWDRMAQAFATFVLQRRWAVLGVGAAVVLLASWGASQVQVRQQVKREFSQGLDFVRDDQTLNARLGGTNAIYLLVEAQRPGAVKEAKVLQAMERTQRLLEQEPDVGKTLSLADFVKRMHQAMNGDDLAFSRVPDSDALTAQYLFLYSVSGEPGDLDSYVDYDYTSATIRVLTKSSDSVSFASLLQRRMPAIAELFGPDIRVSVGGSVAQEAALAEVMVRSKLLNMAQIGGIILLIAALVLRSIVAGVLVIVPLALTVLVNFGLMGLTGIPLNIANALTSAMVVGIGADYAIYFIFRLREELAKTPDEAAAVRATLATAGKATLFVAAAVAGGYGVLALSVGFYLHIWMAILIGTAMVTSSVAALTVLPALILAVRPRFVFSAASVAKTMSPVPTALVLALSVAGMTADVAAQAPPDPTEIMGRNFVATKVLDSLQDTTITLINRAGQQRVRRTSGATKLDSNGVDNMRVVRFVSPPDVAGTATLMLEHAAGDDDIWIYLPALRKVRRIVSSNKSESFVGTDFSYGDVIGHRPQDWRYRLLREETVAGHRAFVIEAAPATDAVRDASGYSRMVHWIRVDNFMTLQSEYWDRQGEPIKRAVFSDIRLVDAERQKWQAMKLEATNVQTGHRTTIVFENFRANQGVPRDRFTTRYLER